MDMSNLNIPIYLNQKVVFDMLAVIEDGFSQISSIQTSNDNKSGLKSEIGAELGASNIFALLGIKLKSSLQGEEMQAEKSTVTQEKVHTPASLFCKLRNQLNDAKIIKQITEANDLQSIKAGDFVEFSGKLQKNPLISLLEAIQKLGELAAVFNDNGQTKGKNNKINDDKRIINQIKAMRDNLQDGNMIDLICDLNSSKGIKAVLPTYIDYFFNRNMNEIIDGEYRILGKVTKIVIGDDESDHINLLRNTSFSLLQDQLMQQMMTKLKNSETAGIDIPEMIARISKPAILVIPISIFI